VIHYLLETAQKTEKLAIFSTIIKNISKLFPKNE
jgi:hypothetical protein